jgi:hypothetical protein
MLQISRLPPCVNREASARTRLAAPSGGKSALPGAVGTALRNLDLLGQ